MPHQLQSTNAGCVEQALFVIAVHSRFELPTNTSCILLSGYTCQCYATFSHIEQKNLYGYIVGQFIPLLKDQTQRITK